MADVKDQATLAVSDTLYEQYGRPLEAEHWGEFVAISQDGRTLLGIIMGSDRSGNGATRPRFLHLQSWRESGRNMATVTRRLIGPRFPYIPLSLIIGSQSLALDALLDTGFDSGIVVPRSLIAPEITPDTHQIWYLADGSALQAPAYHATVTLGHLGVFPTTVTALGNEVLVGRRLIRGFRIVLDFGRRVIVER